MLFNKYQKLLNLETERTEWTIRVRAQSIWEGINRTTMEFRGLNVLFIDDSSCRIHAFLSAKISGLFAGDLKEGMVYSISNFHVKKYEGAEKNRAVRFEKHIFFDNYTRLVPEAVNLSKIPSYAFDLFDLDDVDQFLTDGRFLIDVVGVIEDPKVELLSSKDDPKKAHIKFRICDGRYSLNVTFFNQLAKDLHKELQDVKSNPIVIIIGSAKVNQHDGQTCLNNYPATRFYLNIDHYSVKQLKKSYVPFDSSLFLECTTSDECIDPKIYSIAEIKKFNAEYIERKIKCQVSVKKVEEKNNWYDNVCTSCYEEVNIVNGRYKCEACKRNIPFPDKRFRLGAVCKDFSGLIAIVFPDEEIQRITGRNVFEIENDDSQVGEGINFPPILKAFENKDFIVTLLIEDKNINQSCNVYTAETLDEPPEMLGNHIPSETETVINNPDSLPMDLEASLKNNIDSPQTEMSTNKFKARKSNDSVPCEFDENVPVSKWKNVKREKV